MRSQVFGVWHTSWRRCNPLVAEVLFFHLPPGNDRMLQRLLATAKLLMVCTPNGI
jgi:hypothetical protein